MQEAYQLQRIKYSICCPILGGYLPWQGVDTLAGGGGTYLDGGLGTLGYPSPCPDLAGGGRIPTLARG